MDRVDEIRERLDKDGCYALCCGGTTSHAYDCGLLVAVQTLNRLEGERSEHEEALRDAWDRVQQALASLTDVRSILDLYVTEAEEGTPEVNPDAAEKHRHVLASAEEVLTRLRREVQDALGTGQAEEAVTTEVSPEYRERRERRVSNSREAREQRKRDMAIAMSEAEESRKGPQ